MSEVKPLEGNISTDVVYAPPDERYHYIACTVRWRRRRRSGKAAGIGWRQRPCTA